jgi:hypothetical protein
MPSASSEIVNPFAAILVRIVIMPLSIAR